MEVPKLERKRWFMLAIFCMGSAVNAFQWLEYGILSDIIKKQYDVSQGVVNWFGLIYNVVYIPIVFPITWYSEKHGLIKPIVFGSFGTALAGCLKIFAVKRSLFWLAMLAQGIAGVCQPCFLGMPAILAATWFGAHELSLATAIGVFGNQVGSAVGFFAPSMFVSEGIMTGGFYAFGTLLDALLIVYFPGQDENIGRIGLVFIVAGLAGSIFSGIILDKTQKYKLINCILYFLAAVGTLAFTLTLLLRKLWLTYIIGGLLGFFLTGYLPVGFEYAAELTYPANEGVTSGLLNAAAQMLGFTLIISMTRILNIYGPLAANLLLCSFVFVGAIITAFIKEKLLRQEVQTRCEKKSPMNTYRSTSDDL